MHDPQTVAFDIRRPWPDRPERMKDGTLRWYWPPVITIWHVDPERDGSDDSCGWSFPKLTKAQRSNIEWLAGCEARTPWFQRERAKEPASPADAEALLRAAFVSVARLLRIRLSLQAATRHAISLVHEPADNVRGMLCHLPGWHTNSEDDTEDRRKGEAARLFYTCARVLLRDARPWWRHPRWHFWHWRFQVHPALHFKRWAWSRCCRCGGRFAWGESPVTNSWHGVGPRWFRGEPDVYHSRCGGAQAVTEVHRAE